MKRSILIFPKLKNLEQIQKIRMKYDPLAECIDPHITLVFPFDLNISTKELIEHVEESLTGLKSFNVTLEEITGTLDYYLFLNVKKGNDSIIELRDRLHTGVLSKLKSKLYTYTPHITLGRFANMAELKKAILETESMMLSFETIISEVCIESIDEVENSSIEYRFTLESN